MLDLMYEIPDQKGVREAIINEDAILRAETPILIYEEQGAETAGNDG